MPGTAAFDGRPLVSVPLPVRAVHSDIRAAMASQVDVQGLQRELKGFQSELDGWTQKLVADCEQARTNHTGRVRELDGAREIRCQHASGTLD